MTVQISLEAIVAARSSVVAVGDEFEMAASYPDVTVTDAPRAQSALDELGVAWGQRLDRDGALVQALAAGLLLVGQALDDVDSGLASHLAGLGYVEGA